MRLKIWEIWESEVGLTTSKAVHVEEKGAIISGKVDSLETRMVTIKTKVKDRSNSQSNRKTRHPKAGVQS